MKIKSSKFDTLPQPFTMDTGAIDHSHSEQGWTIGLYYQVFFIIVALYIAFFLSGSDSFATFAIIFSSIVLEAFPFMLFGALIGGVIEVFVSREALINALPNSRRISIVLAGLLGIVFPVCECAIVPVVRKLLGKGMPLGAAIAFLLGGPIVNPLVFASTLVAYSFSWEVAVLRFVAGFGIAIAVGMIIDSVIDSKQALVGSDQPTTCGCGHEHGPMEGMGLKDRLMSALSHGAQDFYDICKFLIIGAFIASALQTLVPRQAFMAFMTNPFIAIFSMMLLAVILNLCSEADAFIASSFQPVGVPLSAQLSFMVLGPMLDIKLILMYLSVFSKKMIVYLVFLVTFMVGFTMLCLEFSKWLFPF